MSGIKLQTATGVDALVWGKTTKELGIGNTRSEHDFIVVGIVDDIIVGVDFKIRHGYTIDLKKRLLKCVNMEFPLGANGRGAYVKRIYTRTKIPVATL